MTIRCPYDALFDGFWVLRLATLMECSRGDGVGVAGRGSLSWPGICPAPFLAWMTGACASEVARMQLRRSATVWLNMEWEVAALVEIWTREGSKPYPYHEPVYHPCSTASPFTILSKSNQGHVPIWGSTTSYIFRSHGTGSEPASSRKPNS